MELILIVVAILFAIVTVVWGGYHLWNRLRRGSLKQTPAQPRYSVAMPLPLVIVFVVLSTAIGSMVSVATFNGLSNVGVLGVWLGAMLGRWIDRANPDIRIFMLSALVVNSALCLAILWGGYLLRVRLRRRCHKDGSNDDIQRLFS